MGSKYEETRKDIDRLYKLSRESEEKLQERTLHFEKNLGFLSTDVKLLSNNMVDMVSQMSKLVSKFESHDEEEMEKYSKIKKTNSKVEQELKDLKNNDNIFAEKLETVTNNQNSMKKNQDKFFKIMYIGIGIGMAFSAIAWILSFYSNYSKAENIYMSNKFSPQEKSRYYEQDVIGKSETILRLKREIDSLKKTEKRR